MIAFVALLCWVSALLSHGLLQPKIQRLLGIGNRHGGLLQAVRCVLPVVALVVCLRQSMPLALLLWLGMFSLGGLLAGGVLTLASVRARKPRVGA
ncbi:hypothetical protein OQ496_01305 [Acetobacter suratthaniensis]|uniref:DUF3325 domain-containing protein n=1 Tax=Acetobacter suratthaniensis TaxID=1502841 RepID=A0ABS3LK14_9PROT|nr:hypothetical protein [Acetobacter suratthaniensis]MBO1327300.1 hypothetical protein [Acetobacter suratthaniensis]MCX2565087.1 hypothetical protein [Acetobacter suratthaniensis]